MIRTDRKTGEPILSPKLTADQLHAMARFFPRTGNGTVPSRRFRGEGPEGRRW